jgi:hypothetical protein
MENDGEIRRGARGSQRQRGGRIGAREIDESDGISVDPSSGRTLNFVTSEGRSAWFCRFGWLVNDVVGVNPETMVAHCRPVMLTANVWFVVQSILMAGLVGGWGGGLNPVSTVQLGCALAVKVAWFQYLLACRPYASTVVLLTELVPTILEVLVLIMALLQASSAASLSTPPATICVVMLFIEVAVVVTTELVRSVILSVGFMMARRQRETLNEKVRDEMRCTSIPCCQCLKFPPSHLLQSSVNLWILASAYFDYFVALR